MTIGRTPDSGLACPLCPGTLETWSRGSLYVEFCDGCAALFLDRGELFEFFRAEGHRCPPEAFLRASFTPGPGKVLACPKCERPSLVPGTLEGCEVWHCTPCNGFLVERSLLLGIELDEGALEVRGFGRSGAGSGGERDEGDVPSYLSRMLQRVAFWTPSEAQEPE